LLKLEPISKSIPKEAGLFRGSHKEQEGLTFGRKCACRLLNFWSLPSVRPSLLDFEIGSSVSDHSKIRIFMKKVFDIGMYDGADTGYYLQSGYQVIAVEANPELVNNAKREFKTQIVSGQLTCVNAAISPYGKEVELTLCGQDLGSSSIFSDRIANRLPKKGYAVSGVTLQQLFERYGLPHYLKVDIEGADRLCILALTPNTRPAFLSFEVGDDVDELLSHLEAIGYKRFKIIHQKSFRELANQRCLYDRVARRVMRYLGYDEPRMIRRAGHFFVTGHSSGPVPWQSDGRWWSGDAIHSRLMSARKSNSLSDWYDIHAA
jgi:FkbM family methyltransferase